MVANPSKFQLTILSKYKRIEKKTCLLVKKTMKSPDTPELLGITPDITINFKRHMQNVTKKITPCHKENNKAKAFFRIRKFLNLEQA